MKHTTVGRPGFGYDDIATAAERIVARNERPSLKNVRAELGGGSMNTIQRHLAQWRERHRQPESTNTVMPSELQRVILAEIQRATESTRATLEVELADLRADRDALAEENQRQAEAFEAAEQRMQEQAAEIERQVGTLKQMGCSLSDAKEVTRMQTEAAEAARKAHALAELRLEALPVLQAEIAALKATLEQEREARRLAEIEAAELRGRHGKKVIG